MVEKRVRIGGGGMASLRIDPQGQAYRQMALEMTIPVPRSWADALGDQHMHRQRPGEPGG